MKQLVLVLATLGAMSAWAATDYYWTGAAGDNKFDTAGNWADASGTAMAAAPSTTDHYGIFTNSTALTLTRESAPRLYGYRFAGSANVTFTANSKNINFGAGGVSNLTSSTVYFNYVTSYPDCLFDYYVAEGGAIETTHTIRRVGSNTVIQKTGAGSVYLCTSKGTNPGVDHGSSFKVLEGTLKLGRTSYNADTNPVTNVRIEFVGDKAKTVAFPMAHWYLGTGTKLLETDVTTSNHYLSDDGKNLLLGFCGTQDDIRFTGGIGGILAFQWKPSNDATFTFAKGYSPSTGSFYVDHGVVRMTEGARHATVYNFRVTDGAQLRLEDEGSVFASSANFQITYSGGARKPLYLANRAAFRYTGTAANATLNGTQLPPGVYTRENCDWIDGDGMVILSHFTEPAATAATWTGNGGADTCVTNPANWGAADNTVLPDLASGSLKADFATGARATIPANTLCRFRGITVSTTSAFTFAKEAGARIQLGSGGLLIPASAGTCRVECPMLLALSQTWAISNKLEFTSSANLDAAGDALLTRTGSGDFLVYSASNHLGNVRLIGGDGLWPLNALHANNALGDGTGTIYVDSTAQRQLPSFYGVTLDSPVRYVKDNPNLNGRFAVFRANTTNVLNGKFSSGGANMTRFKMEKGAEVHFRGGYEYVNANNNAALSPDMDDDTSGNPVGVYVENTPANVIRLILDLDASIAGGNRVPLDFHFAARSNTVTRGVHIGHVKNTLYTEAENFLKTTANGVTGVRFIRPGKWDLCGKNQAVNVLFAPCVTGVVTSATDAQVRLWDSTLNEMTSTTPGYVLAQPQLNGATQVVDSVSFTGGAGLSKEGSLTHYSMGTSTSTGRVSVAAGRLVFTKAGEDLVFDDHTLTRGENPHIAFQTTIRSTAASWTNASEVIVSGGVLELRHKQVFGEGTAVKFAGAGVMDLNMDGVQHVASVSVLENGVWRDLGQGLYTAAKLPAHITGRGALRVGTPGLMVIVR